MTKHPEILVVDDDLIAAKSFSELIKEKYNFTTIFTNDPNEVLDYIKQYPIKVVVLDQVMPKKGTDIFLEIKKINRAVQAIMLTGEAERSEVDKAYKLGYGDFLEKSNIADLPDRVLNLYVKYQIDISKSLKTDRLLIYKQRTLKNLFYSIDYYLYDLQVIEKNYVFEDRWKVTAEINSDEVEIEEVFEYEEELYISKADEQKIITSLNVENKIIDSLKTGINFEINKKFSQSFTRKIKNSKTHKTKYSLNNGNTDSPVIIKKVFEHTPVFVEYSVLICKKCKICDCFLLVPFVLYKRTPKYSTKYTCFYEDGTKKEVLTGILQK